MNSNTFGKTGIFPAHITWKFQVSKQETQNLNKSCDALLKDQVSIFDIGCHF